MRPVEVEPGAAGNEISHRPQHDLRALVTIGIERLLEPIGNMPPAEAEERYYAMLEQPAMAA